MHRSIDLRGVGRRRVRADTVPHDQDTTAWLQAWRRGDPNAMDALMPRLYAALRRLAAHHMRRERADHTLQPTALIHEAWLRLHDQQHLDWQSRSQFIALASTMMRRILLNHARDRRAAKRDGGHPVVGLEISDLRRVDPLDVLAMDRALCKLEAVERRTARVVELRLFGGMTVVDTARHLACSPATVKRELRAGKAWLRRELGGPDRPPVT